MDPNRGNLHPRGQRLNGNGIKFVVAPKPYIPMTTAPPIRGRHARNVAPKIVKTSVNSSVTSASNSNQPSSSSSGGFTGQSRQVPLARANNRVVHMNDGPHRPPGIMRYRKRPVAEPEATSDRETDDMIARFMITNGIPLDRIHDMTFRKMILHLNPNCVIPPMITLEAAAERLGNPAKNMLSQRKTTGLMSVTMDVTGHEDEKFLAFSVHFFENRYERRNITFLRKLLLTTIDAESLMSIIRRAVNNYNPGSIRFSSFVVANSEICGMFNRHESVERVFICFYTHVENFVNEMLQIEDLARGMDELRDFVRCVKSDGDLYNQFRRMQIAKNLELEIPTIDDSSWDSTYVFLKRCLAMHTSFTEFDCRSTLHIESKYIDDQTYNKLDYLLKIMQKCANACRELSLPNNTMSQVVPAIMTIRSFISDYQSGFAFEKEIRHAFTHSFSKVTNGYYSQRYDISSLLDPRFGYRESTYSSNVWSGLERKVFNQFIITDFATESPHLTEFYTIPKEERVTAINAEVRLYRMACCASRYEEITNPMEWWSKRTGMPRLQLLVAELFRCPAVAIDAKFHFGAKGKFNHMCSSTKDGIIENCLTVAGVYQPFRGRGAPNSAYLPRMMQGPIRRRIIQPAHTNSMDRIDSAEEIADLLGHESTSKRPRFGGLVQSPFSQLVVATRKLGPQSFAVQKHPVHEIPIRQKIRQNRSRQANNVPDYTPPEPVEQPPPEQKPAAQDEEIHIPVEEKPNVGSFLDLTGGKSQSDDLSFILKEEPEDEPNSSDVPTQQNDLCHDPDSTMNDTLQDEVDYEDGTLNEEGDLVQSAQEDVSTGTEDDDEDQDDMTETYKPVYLEKTVFSSVARKEQKPAARVPGYGAVPENIAEHNFVQKFAQKQNFIPKFRNPPSQFSPTAQTPVATDDEAGPSDAAYVEREIKEEPVFDSAQSIDYREIKEEPIDHDEYSIAVEQDDYSNAVEQDEYSNAVEQDEYLNAVEQHEYSDVVNAPITMRPNTYQFEKPKACRRRCVICGTMEEHHLVKNVTIYSEKLVVVFGAYLRDEITLQKARECVNSQIKSYVCLIHFTEACDEIYYMLDVTRPDQINSTSQSRISNALMVILSIRGQQMTPSEFKQLMTKFTLKYRQDHNDEMTEELMMIQQNSVQIPHNEFGVPGILPKSVRQPRKQLLEDDHHGAIVKVIEQENFTIPAITMPVNGSSSNPVCCYCSAAVPREEMLKVPKSEERLAQWVDKLGAEFELRLQPGDNLLCRRHFPENAFSSKKRLLKGMVPLMTPDKIETTYKIRGANFLKLNENKSKSGRTPTVNLSSKPKSRRRRAREEIYTSSSEESSGEKEWDGDESDSSYHEEDQEEEPTEKKVYQTPGPSCSSAPSSSDIPSTSRSSMGHRISSRLAQKQTKN